MPDPRYTRQDLQDIGMYAELGSCPDCACVVARMVSGLHGFDDNDIPEYLMSG